MSTTHSKIEWTDRTWKRPTLGDEKALTAPLRWRKPARVRLGWDLFDDGITDAERDQMLAVIALAPRHTFQVLTKRPARARAYLVAAEQLEIPISEEWSVRLPLPNLWVGTSVSDQPSADERIPELLATSAAVRFVSYEPALGPVSFRWLSAWPENAPHTAQKPAILGESTHELDGLRRLDWIICGGESGPGARPFDLAWARSVVAQGKAAGVPVFLKQLGAKPFDSRATHIPVDAVLIRHPKGADITEWPEDLRVQEFPNE